MTEMANMKEQRWLGLTVAVIGAVFVIFLPVILPVVAALQAREHRRMRTAASTFACLSCGSCLGSDAIRLANEAWQQYFANLRAKNPGVRFRTSVPRIVRHLRAICPHCGARYDFVEAGRTFAALGDDRW